MQSPSATDISVNGTATTAVKAIGTDSTTFEFTAAAVLEGASTVATINPIIDLSVETGIFSKVVTFVKDDAAPQVITSQVVKNTADGKEYLELTFDRNVNLDATPANSKVSAKGTYVKDFITSAQFNLGATQVAYKDSTNKKVIQVELDTLLGNKDVKGAVYTLDLSFAKLNSDAGTLATSKNVSFTRGEDGPAASTDVAVVNTVVQ